MTRTVTTQELYDEIDAGTVPMILDVRNQVEFAAWQVEGTKPVTTRNLPIWMAVEQIDDVVNACAPSKRAELTVTGEELNFRPSPAASDAPSPGDHNSTDRLQLTVGGNLETISAIIGVASAIGRWREQYRAFGLDQNEGAVSPKQDAFPLESPPGTE